MRKNYYVLLLALLFFSFAAMSQITKSGLSDSQLRLTEKEQMYKETNASNPAMDQSRIHSNVVSRTLLDCPGSSLFSNPLVDYENAFTAESVEGYKIAQSYYVDGTIDSITFWGLSAYNDGSSWGTCDGSNPEIFDVVFYEMNGQEIGDVFLSETGLEAVPVGTGEMFADAYEIYQYTVVLTTPVSDLPQGYVSIAGATDNSCWFLWIDAPTGSGNASQYVEADGTWSDLGVPMAICLAGEMSTCPAPVDLTATNVTLDQADLGWTEIGNADTWRVAFSEMVNEQVSSTIIETRDNPYTQMGLVNNNQYTFAVQSVCSIGDTSNWSAPMTFATPCDVVTTYPYSEDFDGDWDSWCWNVINADGDDYTWTQASTYISPTHSGEFAAHGMGNNDDWLISPPMQLDDAYQFSWWDKVESESFNNTYEIWVSTTGMAIEDFTEKVAEINCINEDWMQHVVYLNAYAGETVYVAIHQTYSASSYFGFGIDDVEVNIAPACPPVSEIYVTNLTKTTADVGWLENGEATNWNIEFGETGFTLGEGTVVAVTDNPYTITGLTQGTAYDVYIQANCGAETSTWTGPVMFNTSCDVLTDLMEGFEGAVPPMCWYNFANGAGTKVWEQSDANVNSGMYAAKASYQSSGGINEQWLVTGQVTVPVGKALSFYAGDDFGTDYGSMLEVRVSTDTDPMNTDAYENLVTLYESDVVNDAMTPVGVDVTAYEGQDVYFAFVMTDDNGDNWYIDDVAFISCGAPNGLAATDITQTTATLSWESSASSFVVEYGIDAFELGSGTTVETTESSITIEGLEASTIYNFYVKAICGEGDESTWAGPLVFETLKAPCDAISDFPYFQGFEGLDDFDCWTPMYNTASDGGLDGTNLVPPPTDNTWFVLDPAGFSGQGANYIYEGERAVAIGYTAPDFNWLVSPDIDLTYFTEADLNFMVWIKDSVEVDWVTKFYINVFDGENWNTVQTWDENTPDNLYEEQVVVNLDDFTGGVIKVAFIYEFNDGYEMAFDNVGITTAGEIAPMPDFDTFVFDESMAETDIDIDNQMLHAWVAPGTDLTSLVAAFTLTEDGSVFVGDVLQVSGETANDFTDTVIYTLKSADEMLTRDWHVVVSIYDDVTASLHNTLKLYPNPTNDVIWMDGFAAETEINVMDISGKVFMHKSTTASKASIDLSKFDDGLYFIELKSGSETVIRRIIKQ